MAISWNKYPSELSGGEQQRVSIARALASRQRFSEDEPTGALNEETGRKILDYIWKLKRKARLYLDHGGRRTKHFADMAENHHSCQ